MSLPVARTGQCVRFDSKGSGRPAQVNGSLRDPAVCDGNFLPGVERHSRMNSRAVRAASNDKLESVTKECRDPSGHGVTGLQVATAAWSHGRLLFMMHLADN